jgi:pimeloyl-ACP methyl ester carboxylesterase
MRLLSLLHRSRVRPLATLSVLALAAFCLHLIPASADAPARKGAHRAGARPTIVFVHGAFADASGFARVTSRLQHRGYTVISPANPLRGPASDAAYVADVLKRIHGPVVLVAHSYGGAVITEAATQVTNVKALVYLDALALDEGESNADLAQRFPNPGFFSVLRAQSFPQADGTAGTEFFIDPAAFPSVFAADVPARVAAVMATAQRPLALAGDQEKLTAPAWKTIPSWYMVGRQDRIFTAAAQRFMARRAHAHTVEINSSHAVYVSHPAAVTALILRAARAVG